MNGRHVSRSRHSFGGWLVACAVLVSSVAGCSSDGVDVASAPTTGQSATPSTGATAAPSSAVEQGDQGEQGDSGDPLPPGSIPSAAAGPTGAGSSPAGDRAAVRRFTVIGDSITAGQEARSSASAPGADAWLRWVGGAPLVLQGGWAVPGVTTADMRAAAGPSTAEVLVLLGGTNDVHRGIAWADSAANLRAVAAAVGAPQVLVVAIPPSDTHPAERGAYNVGLAQLAAEQGWGFIDPWTSVDVGGVYAPGASVDGIHPTPEVARLVGEQLRAELLLGLGG